MPQAAGVRTGNRNSVLLWAGLLAAPLFVLSVSVAGSLNPGYRHSHGAISRLGALGAPWNLGFAFFGLLLPGLLTAGVAFELRRAGQAVGAKTHAGTGLLVYGAMTGLTAIPADFERMFQSPWTWAHAFFVMASPLVLFAVIPGCARSLRVLGASRASAAMFTVLGYLPALEFLLYGILVNAPGLVQRLMIVTGHLSTAWLSWALLAIRREPKPRPDPPVAVSNPITGERA